MKDMLFQISRVFAFGSIKHPDLRPFLKWSPIIISILCVFIYCILPIKPRLYGDGSLSRHMIAAFTILPGFYIAALAAVATFNREEMDFTMPDPAPEMVLWTGSKFGFVKLTFRMFMSHLFSYLTALSFIAVFMFIIADLTAPSFKFWSKINDYQFATYLIRLIANSSYVLIVSWLSSKIIITTMIGLYFLAERMHRPNA